MANPFLLIHNKNANFGKFQFVPLHATSDAPLQGVICHNGKVPTPKPARGHLGDRRLPLQGLEKVAFSLVGLPDHGRSVHVSGVNVELGRDLLGQADDVLHIMGPMTLQRFWMCDLYLDEVGVSIRRPRTQTLR